MKVILAMGKVTENIIEAIQGSFDEYVDIEGIGYIEEIAQFLNTGKNFNRLIITDRAIVGNKDTKDNIRLKLHSLQDMFISTFKDSTLVVIVTKDVMSSILQAELLEISDRCAIINSTKSEIDVEKLEKIIIKDIYWVKNIDNEDEVTEVEEDNYCNTIESGCDDIEELEEDICDSSIVNEDSKYNECIEEQESDVDTNEVYEENLEVTTDNSIDKEEIIEVSIAENINGEDNVELKDSSEHSEEIVNKNKASFNIKSFIKERGKVKDIAKNKKKDEVIPVDELAKSNKIDVSYDIYADNNVSKTVKNSDTISLFEQPQYEVAQRDNNLDDFSKIELELNNKLGNIAHRGASFIFTGTRGAGTSTIAYNVADTIHNMGYSVLLVDLDLNNRGQSHINKNSYQELHSTSKNDTLITALSNNKKLVDIANIVDTGFHSVGLAINLDTSDDIITYKSLTRFNNYALNSYNFIIYDIPLDTATENVQDFVFNCDYISLIMEYSNKGVFSLINSIGNIKSKYAVDNIFDRAKIIVNKYSNLLMTEIKTKSGYNFHAMDKILEYLGSDGIYCRNFKELKDAGSIPLNINYINTWFGDSIYKTNSKYDIINIISGIIAI